MGADLSFLMGMVTTLQAEFWLEMPPNLLIQELQQQNWGLLMVPQKEQPDSRCADRLHIHCGNTLGVGMGLISMGNRSCGCGLGSVGIRM